MNLNSLVTIKEKVYFILKLLVSTLIYIGIFMFFVNIEKKPLMAMTPLLIYAIFFFLFFYVRHGIFYGYILGNGIRVTRSQLPELYEKASFISERMMLNHMPAIYIMQYNGLLNAFASRFAWQDYIVIYSDIVDASKGTDNKAIDFVLAHEMAHVKRKHYLKSLICLPSIFIPFLNSAYSRACEYTCDRFANALYPTGGKDGLLILAAGRELFKKIDPDEYVHTTDMQGGFWKWFSEIVSSHPNLPKRIFALKNINEPKK